MFKELKAKLKAKLKSRSNATSMRRYDFFGYRNAEEAIQKHFNYNNIVVKAMDSAECRAEQLRHEEHIWLAEQRAQRTHLARYDY